MTWKEILQIKEPWRMIEETKKMLDEKGMIWEEFIQTEECREVSREAARYRLGSPEPFMNVEVIPPEKQRTMAMEDKTIWDLIPKNAAWQCATCKKHIPHTATCTAYPKWIPEEITFGSVLCTEWEEKQGK